MTRIVLDLDSAMEDDGQPIKLLADVLSKLPTGVMLSTVMLAIGNHPDSTTTEIIDPHSTAYKIGQILDYTEQSAMVVMFGDHDTWIENNGSLR